MNVQRPRSMSLALLEPGKQAAGAYGRCALGVMIKAPRAGVSKTRLCPPLQAEEAAELSRRFFKDTADAIAGVCRADDRAVGVAIYTPTGSEPEFKAIVPETFYLLPQRGAGFGERLLNALEDLFSVGFSSVALIDSDSPSLPPACYRQVVERLARAAENQIVIGPTEDGGYYLIAMNQPHRELFTGIDWSTDRVFGQTLLKAKAQKLPVSNLPQWYDVDNVEALERLSRQLLAEPVQSDGQKHYPAPSTAEFLKKRRSSGNGRK
jgi:uncharacterized protein